MSFSFKMLDIGNDDFRQELKERAERQKNLETQFKDFSLFFPRPLIPSVLRDIFFEVKKFTYEDAELTVKWFAYLYFHSIYVNAINAKGQPTSTGKQRQWRFSNILLYKDFVRSFCIEDGKLQIEKSRTLRACLGCGFEGHWDSVIGPDRVVNSKEDNKEKVDVGTYRDSLFKIIHDAGMHRRLDKERLRIVWLSIGRGYAPSYRHLPVNSLEEAAAKTHLTDVELREMVEQHLSKKPLGAITQCSYLRGRPIEFVQGDSYVSFLGCIECDQNRDGQVLRMPDNEQLCRIKGLPPLGRELAVIKRNDFTSIIVKNAISKRDHKKCVVGSQIPGEVCGVPIVLGHVVSALFTQHILTKYDGLCLCQKHNAKMGTKNLLDAFPALKFWVKDQKINARGKNLDLTEWP